MGIGIWDYGEGQGILRISVIRSVMAIGAGLAVAGASWAAPELAAGGLLYPSRRTAMVDAPRNCADTTLQGDGVSLRAWHCRAEGTRRGTIIYLHGIADNRSSSVGAIRRFTPEGFDVLAYDSRRHGASEGDACTYGFFEKRDLALVAGTLPAGPVILIGTSLGAAVALQYAATAPRVGSIVAAEVFADLRTVATERAPWFLPPPIIRKAFRIAEQRGGFVVDDVSPVDAARSIRLPVLLIHGANDTETKPEHSRRVHAALAGPKRLTEVPSAGHNESLAHAAVWVEIDRWIDESIRY